ncbi:uncharacterized protein METZ01_LOCUS233826 [marine metagenome]|uniref:Uncharacterized protein n=1 Tax=marine metagenome TaxID=408172 RepID=A0A382H1C5_9ZZZZ
MGWEIVTRFIHIWGGRRESNPRSPGPQPGVLTTLPRPPRKRILTFILLKDQE